MPRTTFRSLTAQRKDTSHSQLDARHALFPTHAKKKRCAAVRKQQPLLRRRSPRPFPFLSRFFESRPRAFFSLHLTTPFGTPAPTAFFPALCTSLILHSPGASRLRQSLPCFSPSPPPRSVVPDKSGFISPSPPPRVPRPMQPKRGPSASAFPEFPALAFSSLSPLFRSSPPQGTKKAGERPRPVVFCKVQSHTSMTDVPRRTSST